MRNWFVPCNVSYYDVFGAYSELPRVNWKQTCTQIEVNDVVFIYIGKPYSAVMFKCRVTKTNLPRREIDDRKFILKGDNYENYPRVMELEFVEQYAKDQLPIKLLRELGVQGNIQCQRAADELNNYNV